MPSKSRLAVCVAAAGSTNAGVLLYRLQHWITRAKVQRGEHRWCVLSRNDWMTDTGLTLHQYNLALARLKAQGLVIAERHLQDNKVRAFLRPAVLLSGE